MFKDITLLIATVFAIIFMGCLLYGFTVGPMRANYRECGTIFLCHPHR